MKRNSTKPLRPRTQKRIAATSSGDLTANDVIANLFDLFEQLGLRNSQAATSLTDTAAIQITQHPLYEFASAIGELLTSWHQDPQFLDDDGNPRSIPLHAQQCSFRYLAKQAVPNLDESYLLSELQRLGVVSVDKAGFVTVHMRSFPAYEDKRLAIQHTLTSLDSFIRTLRHNLNSTPSNSDQLFHRIAQCYDFDSREIPALKIRVKRYGQTFLESFDDWLRRKTLPKQRKSSYGKRPTHVSIGIYLSIEDR
jgi:hypothetical protein